MQHSEISQIYLSAETSVNSSTLITAKPLEVMHNDPKKKDEDIPAAIVFFAPFCFLIVGAVCLYIIAKLLKFTENKYGILNIARQKLYPCRSCQFFNDNNYIKCAVHPSVVLTKQALDCSDYQRR